jgi:undecaprenyl diphosphate synthase
MGIPTHVAFIMDGNGRWATKRRFERSEGHAKGAQVAESTVRLCADYGIRYVTLFAFSTENWTRPEKEVHFLFQLLAEYLSEHAKEMMEKGVRIRFMGHTEGLTASLRTLMQKIENDSIHCDRLQMILAVNYGGRQEICDGFMKLFRYLSEHPDRKQEIFATLPDRFDQYLYLPDVPAPDLIIRTSGEKRMSNYLLWQCAYSEMYFTDTLWPDFGEEQLQTALQDYAGRKRRFGGLDGQK